MLQLQSTFLVFIIYTLVSLTSGRALNKLHDDAEHRMHPTFNFQTERLHKRAVMPFLRFDSAMPEEEYKDYWNTMGKRILSEQLASKNQLNKNKALNMILFLGDGMSIPTVSAARVYIGGEEKKFVFEQFPYTGLSKTYCANTQVPDSACTATAYLGGVKGNYGTIGVSAAIELNDCQGQNDTLHHVTSIAAWAQSQGMATGLVTTTAVTHASPAGVYANIANRNWENDAEVLSRNGDPNVCTDIATQLVHGAVGSKLSVILGGGRTHFLPATETDISGEQGRRLDGKNLIQEWQQQHGDKAYFVKDRSELLNLPVDAERVMGLFGANHMPFHLDADAEITPSLETMVTAALTVLERQSKGKGFFLFVEGGRIDHAHHETRAMKALDETAEFGRAIAYAYEKTNPSETLIVVTADHSHTMSMAGYSSRKNDIFGINNGQLATDQLPYATLSYANGPGYAYNLLNNANTSKRKNLHQINMRDKDYQFPSTVPLESETHGGDDVAVYATGPFSHLFTGVYEQNFISHAMRYAACLEEDETTCNRS